MTNIHRGMLRVWVVLSALWVVSAILFDPDAAEHPVRLVSLVAGPPLGVIVAWLTLAWVLRGFTPSDYSDRAAGRFRPLPGADYRRTQPTMATAAQDSRRSIGAVRETAGRPAADRPG